MPKPMTKLSGIARSVRNVGSAQQATEPMAAAARFRPCRASRSTRRTGARTQADGTATSLATPLASKRPARAHFAHKRPYLHCCLLRKLRSMPAPGRASRLRRQLCLPSTNSCMLEGASHSHGIASLEPPTGLRTTRGPPRLRCGHKRKPSQTPFFGQVLTKWTIGTNRLPTWPELT